MFAVFATELVFNILLQWKELEKTDLNFSAHKHTLVGILTHIWSWSKQAVSWLIQADGQLTIYMAQGEPGGS